VSRQRLTWADGWWPAEKDVEDYLKSKILECQPHAEFFYAEDFIESLKQADEAARQKRSEEND